MDNNKKWHSSTGRLKYIGDDSLIVEIGSDIARYYRSLIPKYQSINGTRYAPHITVVRTGKDQPIKEFWGKYEGEKINFIYCPFVESSDIYFWLNVLCKRLEDIREELGLPIITSMYAPEGFRKFFHITIGNNKI